MARDSARDSEEGSLSIGALSRATRIPVETLRTWERRYGSPRPVRKASGHRVYPASAVAHLQRVGRLLAQGHRAGEILLLPTRELDGLLAMADAGPELRAAAAPVPAEWSPRAFVDAMLAATEALDRVAMLRHLRTAWVRFGPADFLEQVAGAFLVEIGAAWEAKRLEVRHEHFASACLSDFLRAAREPYDERARGPRVVAAMLPGEEHEGGLLLAATLFAVRGWRVVYLGASTPVDQIAAAAKAAQAEVVAISVSLSGRARAGAAVAKLRAALPARVKIWLGGAGAPAAGRGIERFDSLATLESRLPAAP